MRVVVVGAGRMIGQPVVGALSERHEVVSIGRTPGDYHPGIVGPGRRFCW
jgi:nucleoside-diphosphate-sugar epimerase